MCFCGFFVAYCRLIDIKIYMMAAARKSYYGVGRGLQQQEAGRCSQPQALCGCCVVPPLVGKCVAVVLYPPATLHANDPSQHIILQVFVFSKKTVFIIVCEKLRRLDVTPQWR